MLLDLTSGAAVLSGPKSELGAGMDLHESLRPECNVCVFRRCLISNHLYEDLPAITPIEEHLAAAHHYDAGLEN